VSVGMVQDSDIKNEHLMCTIERYQESRGAVLIRVSQFKWADRIVKGLFSRLSMRTFGQNSH
jgi:hypothetical protein